MGKTLGCMVTVLERNWVLYLHRLSFCYFLNLSRGAQNLPAPLSSLNITLPSSLPLASVPLKFTHRVVQLCVAYIAWKRFLRMWTLLSTLFKVLFRKSSLVGSHPLSETLYWQKCPSGFYFLKIIKAKKGSIILRVCVSVRIYSCVAQDC
jgi:hypothetical protein